MKLVLFAACDKVILDRDGNISLIILLDTLTANIPQGQALPSNAMLPREWYVVTVWRADPEEIGRNFQQIMDIESPFAKLPRTIMPFTVDASRRVKNISMYLSFPAGQQGIVNIRSWLEENGNSVTEINNYEINVVHKEAPPIRQSQQAAP